MKISTLWRSVVWVVASVLLACTNSDVVPTGDPDTGSEKASGISQPDTNQGLTILPVRSFQQTTDYTCGPASIVTLLRYYDRVGDELEIADEAMCTPEKGTNPDDMVTWLRDHGFDVTWGEHGSLNLLRDHLERGVPTLVEWIDYGGHWVLVVGYDTRGTDTPADDVIYFADPADDHDGERDGLTSFNAVRFDAMWFDAFLFDRPMFRVYITARPLDGSGGA